VYLAAGPSMVSGFGRFAQAVTAGSLTMGSSLKAASDSSVMNR